MTKFLRPTFTDRAGYRLWLANWRKLYNRMSRDIREMKKDRARAQRAGEATAPAIQRELAHRSVMATKLMSMLKDAKVQMEKIDGVAKAIAEQHAEFPLDLGTCREVEFYFNKLSLQMPTVPMWVVRTKGKTFYVNSLNSQMGFDTKERPDHPSTKGLIRFRKANLTIDASGVAHLAPAA